MNMPKNKIIIGASMLAVAIGLAIGVVSGFTASKGEITQAQTVPVRVSGSYTNERIESLKAEMDSVAQYEKAYGCTEINKYGNTEFCDNSKIRVDTLHQQLVDELHKQELSMRSPEAIDAVKARIKSFAGDSSEEITFEGTSGNPYTSTTAKRIEHWLDSKGFDYWVDIETNQIVQFAPAPNSKIAFERDGSKSLGADALRRKAEEFLSKNVADFNQVKADYKFRQTSKPGSVSHAFRWESPSKPEGEEMSPFVQVVLSPIGEVMSFNDTRILYSN